MIRAGLLALLVAAGPAAAQDEALPPPTGEGEALPEAGTGQVAPALQAPGAALRWLDKVSGEVGDLALRSGQVGQAGRLSILLDDCRYPSDGAPTEGFAHLVVMDALLAEPVFEGWMSAEAPALNAMDHRRYDVWVLRCLTE
jgi:hypothetical protein